MNSYQIFRQLEEKEKRIKQYKFLDKDELIDTIDELNSKNENLQERIDKALIYIKENTQNDTQVDMFSYDKFDELENILKGDE